MAIAAVASPILTGILLLVAAAALGMHAPHVGYLWLLLILAAMMIAAGTLALFAAFGAIGQALALILFVYLSLASSGGTVPSEALPGFFRVRRDTSSRCASCSAAPARSSTSARAATPA